MKSDSIADVESLDQLGGITIFFQLPEYIEFQIRDFMPELGNGMDEVIEPLQRRVCRCSCHDGVRLAPDIR